MEEGGVEVGRDEGEEKERSEGGREGEVYLFFSLE